ncbi:hypothetical protein [Catenulispora pinisilvae]|uniref:hypothetical protein n=1 Tax=Catenulispora pinisilvae TaxID=2705253 RepID=UPI001890E1BC|nr:hypothetical protein [Catenulispora pinisilvae]
MSSASNVLLVGDRVSALMDAEALGKGTRFHDVAILEFIAKRNPENVHDRIRVATEMVRRFEGPSRSL